MYSRGHRELQDRFHSRRIADRLEAVTMKPVLGDADRAFVASAQFFFLATAGADGWPDCSYKGGVPGFVRVVDDKTLAWDDYDGNGQFRSLGNVVENPKVQLLFIDFEKPKRLRVHGIASLEENDRGLVVTVAVERVFPNCPRYIHKMKLEEISTYAPREGHEPPTPAWKLDARFCDALPRQKP